MANPRKSLSTLPDGATVYTRSSLRFYDLLVHGFSNRFAWRCPSRRLLSHAREHLSSDHLEIGIGSGKLFRKAADGLEFNRLVVADVNPDCLDVASSNLKHFNPKPCQLDLLDLANEQLGYRDFQSLGMTYVLHCLPLTLSEKVEICRQLSNRFLGHGGVLFGATIMQDLGSTWLSKKLMAFYNRKTIFGNQHDTLPLFNKLLEDQGLDFKLSTAGCVCLFSIFKA